VVYIIFPSLFPIYRYVKEVMGKSINFGGKKNRRSIGGRAKRESKV
jgi:hypothetical protein